MFDALGGFVSGRIGGSSGKGVYAGGGAVLMASDLCARWQPNIETNLSLDRLPTSESCSGTKLRSTCAEA